METCYEKGSTLMQKYTVEDAYINGKVCYRKGTFAFVYFCFLPDDGRME